MNVVGLKSEGTEMATEFLLLKRCWVASQ
jgi:hypothetical protein